MKQAKTKVLCVDDEPRVLEGLALQLRRGYEVHTSTSGSQGLEVLGQQGPFAVVLSDMRMPAMDGAAFLAAVRRRAPDTVRMLLTGHADLQAAIAAVNEGHIFRFLTKPCPPQQLRQAFDAAAEQHRLITAERVLLEQTLNGSIKTLVDVLAITSPDAFGRATRVKKHASKIADKLHAPDRWQIELAAMLSELGSISLPEETVGKYYSGKALSTEERGMVERMSKVADDLLSNIPRLEGVREILTGRRGSGAKEQRGEGPVLGSRILEIAHDFDVIESEGLSVEAAMDRMRERGSTYDAEILQLFAEIQCAPAASGTIEIPLQDVRVGMVFAEDVRTTRGVLLVARGYEVTTGFIERVRNFRSNFVREPLRVLAGSAQSEH